MIIGEIKWFDNIKGYGFISWSEDKDVLVHYSVIEGEGYKILNPGDKVLFMLDDIKGRLIAKKVKKIK